MRDVGLVDGEDFVVDWRFAEGRYERLPGLSAELVRLKVDVIVAVTTLCVQAAHHATSTTPIVMVGVPDPVGEGFATSLSRPGGNITGMSNIVTEVSSKHLELLQVAVPRLALVAVLINPGNPSDALILEHVQGTAYTRRIKVLPVEAGTASEIEAGFAGIARARAQALIVATDPFFDVQQELIIRLALAGRLPTISSNREMTEAGGLCATAMPVVALPAGGNLRRSHPEGASPVACPSNSRRFWNSSSTARLRRRSASPFRANWSCAPTASSNDGTALAAEIAGHGLIWPRISPLRCASL